MTIFFEISILLAITTGLSVLARLFKQPLVVGYILAGMLAGPYVLNVLHSAEELELFSRVGIVFLLFIVGLHLNPKVIKEVGKVSLATGLGQVLFTSAVGFGLSLLLGIDRLAALYVAIALTFSSTIIILKLLADKNDLQKLYAKIAIGFLLVQDVVATLVLIGVTVSTSGSNQHLLYLVGLTLLKGVGLLAGLYLASSILLPKITKFMASSQELLFLFSLSWGLALSSIFLMIGFSLEIGALVAGVTLSVSPYANEISSRLKPLRDFFIIIFFILLGSQMVLTDIAAILGPALILSVFVLVGNPIIVILLMNLTGYKRKTGFMAGLTVAQISEFSLILATLGMRVGHISQEVLSLITLVGLITIAGSTYLILYAEKIYPRISGVLGWLELLKHRKGEKGSVAEDYRYIIFGYNRVGHNFVRALQEDEDEVLIVDFNPETIEQLKETDTAHRFGDAADIEFLEELPVTKPKVVVSTISDIATNLLIVRTMLAKNKRAVLLMMAQDALEAQKLYEAGATYVFIPHHLGAEHVAKLLKRHGSDLTPYRREKDKHLRKLSRKYSLVLE